MSALKLLIAVGLALLLPGVYPSLADATWEYLDPDLGFRNSDEFFVTEQAMYIGLSEEDETGLGLYRYRFDEGEWQLFAWDGYQVMGIVVWGANDENLLIRVRNLSASLRTWRSTDGGESWIPAGSGLGGYLPVLQAPSDTSRMICEEFYSTDSGWTWAQGSGTPGLLGHETRQAFDRGVALVAYLTGNIGKDQGDGVYKTTNDGANWSRVLLYYEGLYGVDVEWSSSDHVMAAHQYSFMAPKVLVTSDAGVHWLDVLSPFLTKEIDSPPWWPSGFFGVGSDPDATTYQVWRSDDLGSTWTSYSDGLPPLPDILWFTWIRVQPHPVGPILFVALEPSGVWRLDLSSSSVSDSGGNSGSLDDRAGPRLRAFPNPSTGRVTIELGNDGGLPPRSLRVVDVAGRLVNSLDGRTASGAIRWNVKDRHGRDVASGLPDRLGPSRWTDGRHGARPDPPVTVVVWI